MNCVLLNNDLRHECCPCCGENHISAVGSVRYASPLKFSSIPVRLVQDPELWYCRTCTSSFIQNALQPTDAWELYAAGNSVQRWAGSDEGFAALKCPELVAVMSAICRDGGRLADMGCGAGHLLDFARNSGCETTGIELSKASWQPLQARGHRMLEHLSQIEDASLKIICAFDLVEHLYDLPGFLEECRCKLVPDGALVILTGDIQSPSARLARNAWWYARYPEHIIFPAPRLFEQLPGWRLETALPTYASRGYRSTPGRVVASTALHLLRGNYNGLPSLGPDHRLYVLRNETLSHL